MLGIVIETLIVVIVVFLLNYFLFIRKNKKYNKKKVPVELNYLIVLYNIDVKKINYRQFVWVYSFINTFIVSFIYIIVIYLVEGFILQIIVGIVLLTLLIIICYGLLGRYYERKIEEDEKCKRNRKKVARSMGKK